jgi:hypothetical protein
VNADTARTADDTAALLERACRLREQAGALEERAGRLRAGAVGGDRPPANAGTRRRYGAERRNPWWKIMF